MNCSIGWILVKQYENASPLNKVNLNTQKVLLINTLHSWAQLIYNTQKQELVGTICPSLKLEENFKWMITKQKVWRSITIK